MEWVYLASCSILLAVIFCIHTYVTYTSNEREIKSIHQMMSRMIDINDELTKNLYELKMQVRDDEIFKI